LHTIASNFIVAEDGTKNCVTPGVRGFGVRALAGRAAALSSALQFIHVIMLRAPRRLKAGLRTYRLPDAGNVQKIHKFSAVLGNLNLQPLDDFHGQHFIGGRPGAVFVIVNDRLAKTGRLGQAGRSWNDRIKNQVAKMLANFADDLLG
jgi:hypothetical protein